MVATRIASNDDLILLRERRRRQVVQPSTRVSLRTFFDAAWAIIEPGTPLIASWHVDAICEHLEAVTAGEIRDLIINMPPRFLKSSIVSVVWPVWEWTINPSARFLTASYAKPLAIRDALKSRRLLQSPWFQATWGNTFRLTGDQNEKSRYENDKTGYRLATSVGSSTTGEGGSRLVLDDPHNVKQAESDTQRQSTLDWIDTTWSTRRNDPKTSARVVVMQRLHEEDATGHLLAQGGWEHLCLPQEYVPSTWVTGIGWSDPRKTDGELLAPERFGPQEVANARRELGSYGYAGQHQQDPAPRGGGMFKREWWQRYAAHTHYTRVEQFVDSAFKTGVENDYSVIATWATDNLGSYYVLDVWRERVAYPDLMQSIHDQHAKWAHAMAATVTVVPVVIEDKASGQSAIQTLSRPMPTMSGYVLPALPIIPWTIGGGETKQSRAEGVTPLCQARQVYLPQVADWVEDWILEHEKFPAGAHDDMVDTTSMALTRLSEAHTFGWGPSPFAGYRGPTA